VKFEVAVIGESRYPVLPLAPGRIGNVSGNSIDGNSSAVPHSEPYFASTNWSEAEFRQ
jgi:hypothetical protein